MFRHKKIFSVLLCLLLFYQNASMAKPAIQCQPGQRRIYNIDKCENCPEKQYKPYSGSEISCEICSKCIEEGFSQIILNCTLTKNTVCGCMPGFTPLDQEKQMICFCPKGSGLENAGKRCTRCKEGFYTDKQNIICRKWKECKRGFKFPGNSTSDAVCKDASQEVTDIPMVHTTLTAMPTTATTSITFTSPSNTATASPPNSLYILWLVMACVGILFLMGLLYHICKATRCIHNHTKVYSRKESVCRKPVEESGEKCISLLA